MGDANAEAVRAGSFVGSIELPGKHVSLAIGGFIKAVAIFDSNAESMGADFLPASLGTAREDQNGAFSLDATLTRIYIEGRAAVPSGSIRGYTEWDLNAQNNGTPAVKIRHAYGSWASNVGVLTVGQTWSTMMDPKVLPEGLTEPTVSGAIFVRQALLRWSQPLGEGWTYHCAVEDANTVDFPVGQPGVSVTNVLPDGVLGIEYERPTRGHVRLNGIARRLQVNGATSDATTAWGLALTSHTNLRYGDNIKTGVGFGHGLGRYLLGIQSTAGAMLTDDGDIEPRKNWGAYAAYQHHWTESLRSSAMFGQAHSVVLEAQPSSTFSGSYYGAVNLMWSPFPYLTVGIEYARGASFRHDGSSLTNDRIALGTQIF